jgi:hypothetical protein
MCVPLALLGSRMQRVAQELKYISAMKNAVFWAVTPCGFIINRRFGGTCRLNLKSRRNNASEQKCLKELTNPTYINTVPFCQSG